MTCRWLSTGAFRAPSERSATARSTSVSPSTSVVPTFSPAIFSLLPQRTFYVSSFSKSLGAALRIGFVITPETMVVALRRRKFLQTLSGDAYTQSLVADFVDRRGYTS